VWSRAGPGGRKSLDPESERELYAFHRQATEGACAGKTAPLNLSAPEKLKWTAWAALGDMSQRDARAAYARAVSRLAPGWLSWPQLASLRERPARPAEVYRRLDLSQPADSVGSRAHAGSDSPPLGAGPPPPGGNNDWRRLADEAWATARSAPLMPTQQQMLYELQQQQEEEEEEEEESGAASPRVNVGAPDSPLLSCPPTPAAPHALPPRAFTAPGGA